MLQSCWRTGPHARNRRVQFPPLAYIFRVSISCIYVSYIYVSICVYLFVHIFVYLLFTRVFPLVSIVAPYFFPRSRFSRIYFCPYIFFKCDWVFYPVFMALWTYLFFRIYFTYIFWCLCKNIDFPSLKRGKTRVDNHHKNINLDTWQVSQNTLLPTPKIET